MRYFFLCLLWSVLVSVSVEGLAQDGTASANENELYLLEVQSRLQLFLDDWQGMANDLQYCSADGLLDLEDRMGQLDAKWLLYSQAQQMDISTDDSLLEFVGNIQVARQTALDRLDTKKAELQMLNDFKDAEAFLASQEGPYQKMLQMASKLAMVKQLSPHLEKLKAKEQLLFADIQTRYDAAGKAAEAMPTLEGRMKKLEERYLALKSVSDKIQEAVYQPWIQRIKDYLLGLAAVAMILMFISMMTSKIKALKQARQQAKKLQQMMPGSTDQQYPTI